MSNLLWLSEGSKFGTKQPQQNFDIFTTQQNEEPKVPRISGEKPNIKIFGKEMPIQILFLGMFSSDNER